MLFEIQGFIIYRIIILSNGGSRVIIAIIIPCAVVEMISKSDNNTFKWHALRIGFGTLLISCLLLVSASIAQIHPQSGGGGGGINGSLAYGPFTWNASNFQAFWHEDGISGETLSVNQPDLSGTQRVINTGNLVYSTTKRVVSYKVKSRDPNS
jgi:hypothetical protein